MYHAAQLELPSRLAGVSCTHLMLPPPALRARVGFGQECVGFAKNRLFAACWPAR